MDPKDPVDQGNMVVEPKDPVDPMDHVDPVDFKDPVDPVDQDTMNFL